MAKIGIQEWHGEAIVKKVDKVSNAELYEAAKIIEKHVIRHFKRRTYGTGTGELLRSIGVKKSRWKGWIIGVFGEPTARWEDSLGARALFFEFGRAAPGEARSRTKAQPPRPFFRPGLRTARTDIRRKLGLRAR